MEAQRQGWCDVRLTDCTGVAAKTQHILYDCNVYCGREYYIFRGGVGARTWVACGRPVQADDGASLGGVSLGG